MSPDNQGGRFHIGYKESAPVVNVQEIFNEQVLDLFANTTFHSNIDYLRRMFLCSDLHYRWSRSINNLDFGQFKGTLTELHLSANILRAFPEAKLGMQFNSSNDITFPLLPKKKIVSYGSHPNSILISESKPIKGSPGQRKQGNHKKEIDIIVQFPGNPPFPIICQVKNSLKDHHAAVNVLGYNNSVFSRKLFSRYPGCGFAFFMPEGTSYDDYIAEQLHGFYGRGGAIISFRRDDNFISSAHERYKRTGIF